MDILVAGGTGFIGSYLCEELAARGHAVTALARSPTEDEKLADVSIARGDVTTYEGLPDVVESMDAIVNLVSLSPLYQPRGGARAHETVTVTGTRNLVRAAESTGVERFIQQSALGADPDGATAYIRAKGRADGIVRASDLTWTILQPSVIFGEGDEFLEFIMKVTTPYITGLPGADSARFQPLWVNDFVHILSDVIDNPSHEEKTYEIGGPTRYTLREVTQLIYQAKNKRVVIIPIPLRLAAIGFRVVAPIPFIPFGPDQAKSLNFDNIATDNAVEQLGIDPSTLLTLESYLDNKNSAVSAEP